MRDAGTRWQRLWLRVNTLLWSMLSVGLAVISPCWAGVVAAQGFPELRQLRCVALEVVATDDAAAIGPNRQELHQNLLVAVKSRLPRLQLSDGCPYRLVFWAHIKDISATGRFNAMYGHVELRLLRPAVLVDTRTELTPQVWSAGFAYFHGPKETARKQVLEYMDRFVTDFAAEYYEAGNQ